MEYKVIKRFRDKHTLEIYIEGSTFETEDKNRAQELKQSGYLGEAILNEPPSLLNQNVPEVKSAITAEFTQEQLKELLQQEIDGENRKGVIDHIESFLKGEEDGSGEA